MVLSKESEVKKMRKQLLDFMEQEYRNAVRYILGGIFWDVEEIVPYEDMWSHYATAITGACGFIKTLDIPCYEVEQIDKDYLECMKKFDKIMEAIKDYRKKGGK